MVYFSRNDSLPAHGAVFKVRLVSVSGPYKKTYTSLYREIRCTLGIIYLRNLRTSAIPKAKYDEKSCAFKVTSSFIWLQSRPRCFYLTLALLSSSFSAVMIFNIFRSSLNMAVYFADIFKWMLYYPLQWRHYGLDGVSNHQPHHCLLSRLFGRRSKKTTKLRVTGLSAGNSPGTGEFPAQRASNAENISIWWRHHDICILVPMSQTCVPQGWIDELSWLFVTCLAPNWW